MAIQTPALNRATAGLAGSITHLSLHTANGGSTGADELSGGGYARQAPTYAAPSGGIADLADPIEFGAPGTAATVTHVGFWDGSTWLGSRALIEPREVQPTDPFIRLSVAPVVSEPRPS
ncbi:MAG TPA: hypothetical protein VKZ82_28515 [Nonomuraea sp.]|nr:hypothetical protein [Nonomuraea sp.]